MAESGDEKKHVPTQRRRQKARAEGQVAQSQDLTSAVLLLAALAALWFFGAQAAGQLAGTIADGLSSTSIGSLTTEDAAHTIMRSSLRVGIAVVPILIALLATGILINVTQTGFLFLPNKVAPSLTNINPATGLGRIVSMAATARLGFGLVKTAMICGIAYAAIHHYGFRIANLANSDVQQVAGTLFDCLMGTCTWIAAGLLALAVLDYGFQRWKHERDLMMTDQELREEMKETEGDPAIVDQRKQSQRNATIRRTETQITSADVIITGPNSTAIALQYNPMTMAAPTVVAKGRGESAASIERTARRNNILIVDRPLLAEHQFRTTSVGSEITADQYQVVAQILRMLNPNQQSAA